MRHVDSTTLHDNGDGPSLFDDAEEDEVRAGMHSVRSTWEWMIGWMLGWVDRLIDGWMDAWMNGGTVGWVPGC